MSKPKGRRSKASAGLLKAKEEPVHQPVYADEEDISAYGAGSDVSDAAPEEDIYGMADETDDEDDDNADEDITDAKDDPSYEPEVQDNIKTFSGEQAIDDLLKMRLSGDEGNEPKPDEPPPKRKRGRPRKGTAPIPRLDRKGNGNLGSKRGPYKKRSKKTERIIKGEPIDPDVVDQYLKQADRKLTVQRIEKVCSFYI